MCEKKNGYSKKYGTNDFYFDNMKMQHICPMMMPMYQSMNNMHQMMPVQPAIYGYQGCPMMNDKMMMQQKAMYHNQMPMCQMHYMPMQSFNYYHNPQLDEPIMEMGEIGIKDWYEEYESEDSSEDNINNESEDIYLDKMKKKHGAKAKNMNTCCHWQSYQHNSPFRSEEYYEEEE